VQEQERGAVALQLEGARLVPGQDQAVFEEGFAHGQRTGAAAAPRSGDAAITAAR